MFASSGPTGDLKPVLFCSHAPAGFRLSVSRAGSHPNWHRCTIATFLYHTYTHCSVKQNLYQLYLATGHAKWLRAQHNRRSFFCTRVQENYTSHIFIIVPAESNLKTKWVTNVRRRKKPLMRLIATWLVCVISHWNPSYLWCRNEKAAGLWRWQSHVGVFVRS